MLLPGFNAVINPGHHLCGKHHHHHFTEPRHQQRRNIQNIQGCIRIMFEAIDQG